jgi:hypothetical protein
VPIVVILIRTFRRNVVVRFRLSSSVRLCLYGIVITGPCSDLADERNGSARVRGGRSWHWRSAAVEMDCPTPQKCNLPWYEQKYQHEDEARGQECALGPNGSIPSAVCHQQLKQKYVHKDKSYLRDRNPPKRARGHIKTTRIHQLTHTSPVTIKNIRGAIGASKGSPFVPKK